ncbi:heat shock protein HtpX [Thermosulfidibacter takaii ABI70S6]|uniref:Protease HtpX homolog n=1 Tax=Thermosulfidibacter takaii (strain DSM 17441 / JCM 13301 / NBRC 103674 / ABI70S6) TaxID=1298851 RepID=A0A0S3QVK5_THET7|nr:zinc metalloprotease HtpX [Thermosulfidibacter takaii]BAT72354.1 heat shock protein HtpX [Thermosulfidibacter takaii ABI70S6]
MGAQIRTFLLLSVLTVLFIMLGKVIGGQTGMVIAFFFAMFMNFFAYWFSDKVVLAMYRAKPVSEAEAPELYRIVRTLCQKANLPMPKIYIIPSQTPNAFATGRNPKNAAVAVTEGILRLLNEEELMGVLAHELAHIKHRDILIQTVAATVVGAITMLADWGRWMLFWGAIGGDDDRDNPFGLIAAILMLVIIPIAAVLIQLAISRAREYYADEGGAKMCGNPLYLANALRKLAYGVEKYPMENANPGTAHMFIVNPLKGEGLLSLLSTHPPIEERIRRLERMAGVY